MMETARQCPLPLAIVTINPDIFSPYVVPAYTLDQVFPVIVTSWEEQSVDKNALSLKAMQRLDNGLEVEKVLLVDNLEANVQH